MSYRTDRWGREIQNPRPKDQPLPLEALDIRELESRCEKLAKEIQEIEAEREKTLQPLREAQAKAEAEFHACEYNRLKRQLQEASDDLSHAQSGISNKIAGIQRELQKLQSVLRAKRHQKHQAATARDRAIRQRMAPTGEQVQ